MNIVLDQKCKKNPIKGHQKVIQLQQVLGKSSELENFS